jgi:hypothetical protein
MDPNAVSSNRIFPFHCNCLADFIWNNTIKICVRNCSSDSHADSIDLNDPTQCKCHTNFIWDSNNNMCVPDCSNIKYA